jgi:hypothetical protein
MALSLPKAGDALFTAPPRTPTTDTLTTTMRPGTPDLFVLNGGSSGR